MENLRKQKQTYLPISINEIITSQSDDFRYHGVYPDRRLIKKDGLKLKQKSNKSPCKPSSLAVTLYTSSLKPEIVPAISFLQIKYF